VSHVVPEDHGSKIRSNHRRKLALLADSEQPGPISDEGLGLNPLENQGKQQANGEGSGGLGDHVGTAFGSGIGSSRIDGS
jgi:hypothetical protein